ncbi:MAG TPA: MFS transporter [Acidobacteriota bacterium]|nr:MFS transporter [Acidobacteriota bacterium]HNG93206.1 MFS transporter [Acidobacteriota bacterium]HNH82015.1 MFS transporter [Acidobacteriota bacterium]
MRKYFPHITKPILILGLVSLFTDIASEMLYPVAPLFLKSLGASTVLIGALEGFVEFISGLLKGYFGALSDRKGSRAGFVRAGYALSALAKPLPGLWTAVGGVVTGRIVDRLGKGMRSAPRDALLASYGGKKSQGAVFGFHRAMDTLGAALGPLLALGFLVLYPNAFRELYLLAFIPSILAVVATFFVSEVPFTPKSDTKPFAPFAVFSYWHASPPAYKRIVIGLTLFALVNSSDVFLILKAGKVGFSTAAAIGGYVFYNLVYALAAYPLGVLADSFGKRRVLVSGLILYAAVYVGFALLTQSWHAWVLFALYGLYAAATEGIAKAWIADLVPNEDRGKAIGLQTMLASFGTLVASLMAGVLWDYVSPSAPFWLAAVGAIAAIPLLKKSVPPA